jgi:hypothetical protein
MLPPHIAARPPYQVRNRDIPILIFFYFMYFVIVTASQLTEKATELFYVLLVKIPGRGIKSATAKEWREIDDRASRFRP